MVAISDERFAEPDLKPVVEINELSRHFGAKLALDRVSLTIPTGCVLGLVGENGAGKTTLIKHVLGLLRAEAGKVHVFGLDPAEQPVQVLARIGYLSEEPFPYDWLPMPFGSRSVETDAVLWRNGRSYCGRVHRDIARSGFI